MTPARQRQRSSRLRKALVIVVVLLVVIGAGVVLARPWLQDVATRFAPSEKTTEVRLQTVGNRALTESVSAPGRVEPMTRVDIAAQVSARIIDLPVREGDEVEPGDVIVRLDDRDLRSALASVSASRDGEQARLYSERARLEGLASSLTFAQRELERQKSLFETGDVSRKSYDDAAERVQDLESSVRASEHTIAALESSLARSESEIKRAQDNLDNTVITAPMAGVVTKVNMEVGEQVLGTFNNMGSVIMTVADLEKMLVKAEVPESDIAAVETAQRAKIYINAYPDDVFTGSVTQIALQRTTSSDGAGVFEVEVEIDREGRRILSGLAANVDIEIETHQGVIVESQAIVERLIDDLPASVKESDLIDRRKRATIVAYRVIDGRTVCTPVITGPSDLTHTLVEQGLSEGDVVVIGPYKVLEDLKHDVAVSDIDAPEDAGPDADETPTEATAADDAADDAAAGAADADAVVRAGADA